MKIENPKVTLSDDARIGVNPEARSGFLDWLMSFSVTGDDGELYNVGGSILSMDREQLDLVSVNMSKGKGYAQQLPGSIYKICRYPGMAVERLFRNPKGTLNIEHKEHSIMVTCGPQYQLECFDNNTWHLQVNSGDNVYSADLWHRPQGFPLWYGREKPSFLTQHSVTYGYNWAGAVDGEIVYEGKKIRVSGLGIRERYVAVDSSAAELGAWEDWGFISFNEVHASMYDMRAGMKDFSVYDLMTNKHYPEGKLTITHEDWAFFRELDGFVPTTYRVKIEVEDGVYDMEAHVVNGTTWGVTYKVPDNPVATLTYGQVTGTFTTKEGLVRTLTGGRGTMSIRQWHAYPNILPRELYSDEVLKGEKFETL